MSTESGAKPAPWHSIFPTPSSKPSLVSAEELKEWMGTMVLGEEVLVVDARRTDFEVNSPYHELKPPSGLTKFRILLEHLYQRCTKPARALVLPNHRRYYENSFSYQTSSLSLQ